MAVYEILLEKAHDEGLIVKEKTLQSSDGRIKDNRIAIRQDIGTTTEKTCVLAEELGHYHTTVGDIISQSDLWNRKQERQARIWAYNNRIGLRGLVQAYEHGCQNQQDIANFLGVTEEFLQGGINCYREKYGVGTSIDNYYIMFIPYLAVGNFK